MNYIEILHHMNIIYFECLYVNEDIQKVYHNNTN